MLCKAPLAENPNEVSQLIDLDRLQEVLRAFRHDIRHCRNYQLPRAESKTALAKELIMLECVLKKRGNDAAASGDAFVASVHRAVE